MSIKILATSSALPARTMTNQELEKLVDTSDEWITKMTGIKERHILSGSESFIDFSYQVASNAIQQSGISLDEIGLIVLGTTTPQQVTPSSAVMLQGMLGMKECIAFDLQAACSGFIYALSTAYYFMLANPNIKYSLVLGCDALSKITDWTDRSTCILLADGFGAMVLGRDNDPNHKGILYSFLGANGAYRKELEVEWGVGHGYDAQAIMKKHVYMNGKEVFKNAVYYFIQMILDALEKSNLSLDDIDWFIPHQANVRIINAVIEKLNCPAEKVIITIHEHGNTSAGSIPLAFDTMVKRGVIKRGDKVLVTSFGAGFTYGLVIFEY